MGTRALARLGVAGGVGRTVPVTVTRDTLGVGPPARRQTGVPRRAPLTLGALKGGGHT